MNSKRVTAIMSLLNYISLFMLLSYTSILIVPVESVSSVCGCIEIEKLKTITNKSSIVWNDIYDDSHDKCDLFCGSKMSTRFVQVDSGVCDCFNDTQLQTFDCDEVQSTSRSSELTVTTVYCVHARFNVHQALSLHAAIFESPIKTFRSSSRDDFIEVHEDESAKFNVSSGIAPAAILLALISIAVLILLACKTWYDHQQNKLKESEENIEDVKEKDGKKVSFIWNFDEHKVKEHRGENYI